MQKINQEEDFQQNLSFYSLVYSRLSIMPLWLNLGTSELNSNIKNLRQDNEYYLLHFADFHIYFSNLRTIE
jgi:hypothetical protein